MIAVSCEDEVEQISERAEMHSSMLVLHNVPFLSTPLKKEKRNTHLNLTERKVIDEDVISKGSVQTVVTPSTRSILSSLCADIKKRKSAVKETQDEVTGRISIMKVFKKKRKGKPSVTDQEIEDALRSN